MKATITNGVYHLEPSTSDEAAALDAIVKAGRQRTIQGAASATREPHPKSAHSTVAAAK